MEHGLNPDQRPQLLHRFCSVSFDVSLTAFWDFGPVSRNAEDDLLAGPTVEGVSVLTLVLHARIHLKQVSVGLADDDAVRDLGGLRACLPTSWEQAEGSDDLDTEVGWTPGQETLDRLTHTHRDRGPGPVDAFGRGDSVLVLVPRLAADPNDLALLVPAARAFFVGSVGDSWRLAIVFIWQTKDSISQNGSA